MPSVPLRDLIRKRQDIASVVTALVGSLGAGTTVEDPDGALLFGERDGSFGFRCAVMHDGEHLGWVCGGAHAPAVAAVLEHLAAKEAERKTLANEVRHL